MSSRLTQSVKRGTIEGRTVQAHSERPLKTQAANATVLRRMAMSEPAGAVSIAAG